MGHRVLSVCCHSPLAVARRKPTAARRGPIPPPPGIIGTLTAVLHDQISQSLEQSVRQAPPYATKSASHWSNRYAQTPLTRPNQPATGAISTLRLHSHAQISHRLAENNRLQIGHATKSSTGWSNPYANRHLTRPNQPANGTISTLRPLYPTKSASHWRNPDASRHPTRPKTSSQWNNRTPTPRSRDRNIHRLEQSVH